MSTPKYIATGIRLGLISPSEVQVWVNSQIQKTKDPSDELIQLAYVKEKDIHDMFGILSAMPDEMDEYDAVRELLKNIETEKLNTVEFCWRLTQCLYSVWTEHNYSAPDDLTAIGFLEDEYRMANNGTFGTVEEWHVNFKEFIASFSKHS